MENLVGLFKLLSDETRLRVVSLLYNNELCVCQITGILNVSQPKVSKALSKMRDLNLVNDTRKDKFVYYTLKEDELLRSLLTDIHQNISNYPMLKSDYDQKDLAKSFLTKCDTSIPVELK